MFLWEEKCPLLLRAQIFSLAVFFYEGIWFQDFLCLDMLDFIIMLPPVHTLLILMVSS